MSPTAEAVRVVIVGRAHLRRTIRDALVAAGMNVVAGCGSRAEALEAVGSARPDVCIVDREVDGGGLIATAALASPPRPPKVLVIGGGDAPEERRAAEYAGAAEYLPGDPDAGRLVAAVQALAGLKRTTRPEV